MTRVWSKAMGATAAKSPWRSEFDSICPPIDRPSVPNVTTPAFDNASDAARLDEIHTALSRAELILRSVGDPVCAAVATLLGELALETAAARNDLHESS
jgi:hypothetical protein